LEDNLVLPSKNIEPLILALSHNNQSFFLKVKKYLDTRTVKNKSYFNDSKYQKVFNVYTALFEKLKGPPKKTTMLDVLEKTEQDETVLLYLNSIVEKMYEQQELDEQYIEDETINFIKQTRAYEAVLKAHMSIEKKQYSELVDIMTDAVQVNFDKDIGMFFKDVEENIRSMSRAVNEKVVSTGFLNLDKCIDEKGMGSKTLNIIAAISGGYKSGTMANIAVNAMMEGKKVVFYTFETSTQKILGRLYAQATRMNMKNQIINENDLIDKVKKISTSGDIIILEKGSNTFCADDMSAHLKDLKMYKNFVPDLIVVDYLGITMNNNRKMASEEGSYEYYKEVAEQLRNLAINFDVPLLTALQLNRGAYSQDNGGSKGKITGNEVSASMGILATADSFITITQSEKDKEEGKIYLSTLKSRNEGSGTKILFNVDYEHHTLRELGVIKQGSNNKVKVNA